MIIAAIQRIAAQHGTKVIVLDRLDRIAPDARLPDGQHFSAAGHAKFAAYLVPKVRAAGVPRDNQGETAASIRMRMRRGWTDGARA